MLKILLFINDKIFHTNVYPSNGTYRVVSCNVIVMKWHDHTHPYENLSVTKKY